MNAKSFFSAPSEYKQLYKIYQEKAATYKKIKDKIAGVTAKEDWQRGQRGRWVFLLAITIIAAISTVFIVFAGTTASLVAVWIIWLATAVLFAITSGISYKNSYAILLENMRFFELFELLAEASKDEADFEAQWQAKVN